MGVLYSAFPIDDDVREWLTEEGIPTPVIDGRAPTPNELKTALDTLEDEAVSYNISEGVWQAQIEDATSPATGPWTMINVLQFSDADEPCEFYFAKGWPELIIKVVHRIAQICGPIAIVPDTGCSPVIVEMSSDVDKIIETWEHLTG